MPQATQGTKKATSQKRSVRTFVLDTSVLLSDPGALRRFAEHEVVLPVVVITELEAKRHHPELGFFARTALRVLDELRTTHGRLDEAVPIGEDGGTIRVELNHTDAASLPSGFRLGDNDTRILAVARNLANEHHDVTLVSKDLPMRIKASAVGLRAEEYHGERTGDSDPGYSGMAELEVPAAVLDELYDDGWSDIESARDLPRPPGPRTVHPGFARVGGDSHRERRTFAISAGRGSPGRIGRPVRESSRPVSAAESVARRGPALRPSDTFPVHLLARQDRAKGARAVW